LDALPEPISNPLTRLAVRMDANGALSAIGYDADRPVTSVTTLSPES